MLSQINRGIGRDYSMMAISILLNELNGFFNVRGNMSDAQIALTAELILDNENFYDLTLGNIKACFRERMMTEKLYDRLDGNIIIGWLREFKSEMADHCENVHIGQERAKQREENADKGGAISSKVYLAMLEARANDGDEEAGNILADIRKRSKILSPEEQHEKDLGFFKFKQQYLKEHGYYDNDKKNDQP